MGSLGLMDYTKHLPGFSLVDQIEKNKDNDNPLIFTD